jgi:5-hydroxyisourate hydrolase
MIKITTHVLDTVNGCPAQGIPVTLEAGSITLVKTATDRDGRALLFEGERAANGLYRLTFQTGRVSRFFPEVTIHFQADEDRHYHVPLLLSAYGYTTYRGS